MRFRLLGSAVDVHSRGPELSPKTPNPPRQFSVASQSGSTPAQSPSAVDWPIPHKALTSIVFLLEPLEKPMEQSESNPLISNQTIDQH